MKQLAIIVAALAASVALAGPTLAQSTKKAPAKATRAETCETVKALAAGFGKEKVTGFANGNLDVALNDAKNRLADKGAKGFKVGKRRVACENYIDFGGAIGREHKCTATAQLCGRG